MWCGALWIDVLLDMANFCVLGFEACAVPMPARVLFEEETGKSLKLDSSWLLALG